jgi:hypothetical protein
MRNIFLNLPFSLLLELGLNLEDDEPNFFDALGFHFFVFFFFMDHPFFRRFFILSPDPFSDSQAEDIPPKRQIMGRSEIFGAPDRGAALKCH